MSKIGDRQLKVLAQCDAVNEYRAAQAEVKRLWIELCVAQGIDPAYASSLSLCFADSKALILSKGGKL